MKVVVLRGPRSHSFVAPWQAAPHWGLPGLPCDAAKMYVPSSTFHEQLVELKGVLIAGPPGDRWHCPTLSTTTSPSAFVASNVTWHNVPHPGRSAFCRACALRSTVSVNAGAKPADTCVSAVRVTSQAPLPLHAPPHPVNSESAVSVAVSVTFVPRTFVRLQSPGQSMPAGSLTTRPAPPPVCATVRV